MGRGNKPLSKIISGMATSKATSKSTRSVSLLSRQGSRTRKKNNPVLRQKVAILEN